VSCEKDQRDTSVSADIPGPRKAWISPKLLRLEAGKAEIGANQVRIEGTFAQGS
jgi:hypothetical protein